MKKNQEEFAQTKGCLKFNNASELMILCSFDHCYVKAVDLNSPAKPNLGKDKHDGFELE